MFPHEHETATFTIEVDVAVARPPCPTNIRTATVVLTTDEGELAATLGAIHMVLGTRPWVVMPTATRVIEVVM